MPVSNVDLLVAAEPAADLEVIHSPAKRREPIQFDLIIKYVEVSNDVQQATGSQKLDSA